VKTEELHEKARRCLKELGPSSDKVAMTLKRMGVKGIPGEAKHCPIANYMKKKTFRLLSPLVAGTFSFNGPLGREFVYLPRSVTAFVKRFDQEKYPFLKRGK